VVHRLGVRVEPVAVDRFLDRLRLHLVRGGEERQRADGDALRVDAEVAPHRGAGVGQPEPVGAEDPVPSGDPVGDLAGDGPHPVGHGDEGAGGFFELAGHERHPRLLMGVAAVPRVTRHPVASELVPARAAPDVSGDVPLLGEQLLGLEGEVDRRPAGQDLRPVAAVPVRGLVAVHPADDL
jgi:hypothetical protein